MSVAVHRGIQMKCNIKTATISPFDHSAFLPLALFGHQPFLPLAPWVIGIFDHWPVLAWAVLASSPSDHQPQWPSDLVSLRPCADWPFDLRLF